MVYTAQLVYPLTTLSCLLSSLSFARGVMTAPRFAESSVGKALVRHERKSGISENIEKALTTNATHTESPIDVGSMKHV